LLLGVFTGFECAHGCGEIENTAMLENRIPSRRPHWIVTINLDTGYVVGDGVEACEEVVAGKSLWQRPGIVIVDFVRIDVRKIALPSRIYDMLCGNGC